MNHNKSWKIILLHSTRDIWRPPLWRSLTCPEDFPSLDMTLSTAVFTGNDSSHTLQGDSTYTCHIFKNLNCDFHQFCYLYWYLKDFRVSYDAVELFKSKHTLLRACRTKNFENTVWLRFYQHLSCRYICFCNASWCIIMTKHSLFHFAGGASIHVTVLIKKIDAANPFPRLPWNCFN